MKATDRELCRYIHIREETAENGGFLFFCPPGGGAGICYRMVHLCKQDVKFANMSLPMKQKRDIVRLIK